jgi:hypothetical protein
MIGRPPSGSNSRREGPGTLRSRTG